VNRDKQMMMVRGAVWGNFRGDENILLITSSSPKARGREGRGDVGTHRTGQTGQTGQDRRDVDGASNE
jgi:hypothetical protein